ncbi:MAG: HEAT repeat domain-containing protein [Polyangiaceae bacterium]|nr:HEAT repeat domain-containing protein [Polyangiaceae bacterium]
MSATSNELIQTYLREPDRQTGQAALAELHRRGGREEFSIGQTLAQSNQWEDRVAAAYLLGQLGWDRPTFLKESVDVLLCLLSDSQPPVVAAAATALGFRADERAIPSLVAHSTHPDAQVRLGVTQGLLPFRTIQVQHALIGLASDIKTEVRSWATFALANNEVADGEDVRLALLARADDVDPETRGEALIGLAMRGDERALPFVKRELNGPFHGDWAVEAAEHLGRPELYPSLQSLFSRISEADKAAFAGSFQRALEACQATKT